MRQLFGLSSSLLFFLAVSVANANDRPNVLWIYVDDMSDWVGCYGDAAVPTPAIDRLANEGIRFENAFMPSPVCSTTRSALITGYLQTSLGLHHHRTMIKQPLNETTVTIPELFRDAGYMTFNETKDDYNFKLDRAQLYSPKFNRPGIRSHLGNSSLDWMEQLRDTPFFARSNWPVEKLVGKREKTSPQKVESNAVPFPFLHSTPMFR